MAAGIDSRTGHPFPDQDQLQYVLRHHLWPLLSLPLSLHDCLNAWAYLKVFSVTGQTFPVPSKCLQGLLFLFLALVPSCYSPPGFGLLDCWAGTIPSSWRTLIFVLLARKIGLARVSCEFMISEKPSVQFSSFKPPGGSPESSLGPQHFCPPPPPPPPRGRLQSLRCHPDSVFRHKIDVYKSRRRDDSFTG